MPNIEIKTTLDILYLALGLSSLGIAFFLCWTLYYLLMSLKDARYLLHGLRRRMENIWDVIGLLKEKLQVGGAMFTLATRGIKELAEYVRQWNESQTRRKTKKTKQSE